MQIIRPQKYTFDMLCNYEAAEHINNRNVIDHIYSFLLGTMLFMTLVFPIIATLYLFKKGFLNKSTLLISDLILSHHPNLSVIDIGPVVYMLMFFICPICIHYILRIIPRTFTKVLLDTGIITARKFHGNKWYILKNSLYRAERCIKILTECENEPEITKAEGYIIVKYKEAGYTKEEKFFFENTDKICKDNLLDFSVLDEAIDEYFRDNKIEVNEYIGAKND